MTLHLAWSNQTDCGNGSYADYSGWNNVLTQGTAAARAVWSNSPVTIMVFDGNDYMAQATADPELNATNRSVLAWIRWRANASWNGIVVNGEAGTTDYEGFMVQGVTITVLR